MGEVISAYQRASVSGLICLILAQTPQELIAAEVEAKRRIKGSLLQRIWTAISPPVSVKD